MSALFTVQRHHQNLFFDPVRLKDYLSQRAIKAYNAQGQPFLITPQKEDIIQHRSYHYQTLTRRGTVEFRSVCTQPLTQTFAPIAFQLGLFCQLETLEELLSQTFFLKKYQTNPQVLRKRFSKQLLTPSEEADIRRFTQELLACSVEGLRKRGFQEEGYLLELLKRFSISL